MPGRPLRTFAVPLILVGLVALVIGRTAVGAVGLCLAALMLWAGAWLDRRISRR